MSEAEAAVETNPITDMIQYALDQDFNKANDVFNSMMSVKMSDVLDQEKIKLADQLYNGGEEDEDEDDEQLDFEFDEDEDDDDSLEDEDLEDDNEEEEE